MDEKYSKHQSERLRKQFVKDYPIEKIKALKMDEYIIGKGSDNPSFCYRLEIELKSLGSFKGARSDKFGVYYGKFGKDKTPKYRCSKKFSKSGNADEALKNVKLEIVKLLEAGKQKNHAKIRQSLISPMFRGKLLSTYYPNDYLPIFDEDHLSFFLKRLGLSCEDTDMLSMQQKLIEWKEMQDDFKNFSLLDFHFWLYEQYNPKEWEKRKEINSSEDNKLKEDIDKTAGDKIPNDFSIQPGKKVKPKTKDGIAYYPRDVIKSKTALKRAAYQCELNCEHKSFIRKSDGHPYMEAHHLIPTSEYQNYEYSLDNLANIVSLCSECHNQIHYGKDTEKLVAELYRKREKELKQAGISITLEKLLEIYRGDKK